MGALHVRIRILVLAFVAAVAGCSNEVTSSAAASGSGGGGATTTVSGGGGGGNLFSAADAGDAGLPACDMTGCPGSQVCCRCYGSPVPGGPGGDGPDCASHCVMPCVPNVDGCQPDGCGAAPK